jgi:hypothetical protein
MTFHTQYATLIMLRRVSKAKHNLFVLDYKTMMMID